MSKAGRKLTLLSPQQRRFVRKRRHGRWPVSYTHLDVYKRQQVFSVAAGVGGKCGLALLAWQYDVFGKKLKMDVVGASFAQADEEIDRTLEQGGENVGADRKVGGGAKKTGADDATVF